MLFSPHFLPLLYFRKLQIFPCDNHLPYVADNTLAMSRAKNNDFILGTKVTIDDANISHQRLPTEEQVCEYQTILSRYNYYH